jgi:hypothetical protein
MRSYTLKVDSTESMEPGGSLTVGGYRADILRVVSATLVEVTFRDNVKGLDVVKDIDDKINCGYECHFTKEYGFVPEEGCPIHDLPKIEH